MSLDYLVCPHCGYRHNLHDGDVYTDITSYYGDVEHRFSCFDCGRDFTVTETVTRT